MLEDAGWAVVPFNPAHDANRWTHHAVAASSQALSPIRDQSVVLEKLAGQVR